MIVKCTNCHHEWQATAGTCSRCGLPPYYHEPLDTTCDMWCDWCGAPAVVQAMIDRLERESRHEEHGGEG